MDDWCPGAVRLPQAGGVTLNKALPPRGIWHITWDALKADGSQPAFSAVRDYLARMGYCPHIMWDPFTGYMEQFYPASVGGRALAAWNEDGAANIQVEVFFTPGCVRDGVKYDTVADTPLVGLDTLLAWMDGHGIPREWPLGTPKWSGNSRDPETWNTRGGHYGHCHVPDNSHSDPGPMPNFSLKVNTEGTVTTVATDPDKQEEKMFIIASDSAVNDGKVWMGDGLVRRHVPDPGTLKALQDMASWGMLNIYKGGQVQNLPQEALGVDVVKATAAATVSAPFTYLDPVTGQPSKTEPVTNMGSQLGSMAFQFVETRKAAAK